MKEGTRGAGEGQMEAKESETPLEVVNRDVAVSNDVLVPRID